MCTRNETKSPLNDWDFQGTCRNEWILIKRIKLCLAHFIVHILKKVFYFLP